MLKKILLTLTGTAAVLGVSTAAFAKPPHWAPAHGYRAHHEHYRPYYAPRAVYVAPRPIYVVPAPRVVYAAPPAPVYYPAPVYHPAPAPLISPYGGAPSVSIRLNLPL